MEEYYLKIDGQEFPEESFNGIGLKASRPDVLGRRGSRAPGQLGYQPFYLHHELAHNYLDPGQPDEDHVILSARVLIWMAPYCVWQSHRSNSEMLSTMPRVSRSNSVARSGATRLSASPTASNSGATGE